MKTINVTFLDAEHKALSKKKGTEKDWRRYILEIAGIKEEEK